MATHSSILAWRIPGTEEPGGLRSVGSKSLARLGDQAHAEEQKRCSVRPCAKAGSGMLPLRLVSTDNKTLGSYLLELTQRSHIALDGR